MKTETSNPWFKMDRGKWVKAGRMRHQTRCGRLAAAVSMAAAASWPWCQLPCGRAACVWVSEASQSLMLVYTHTHTHTHTLKAGGMETAISSCLPPPLIHTDYTKKLGAMLVRLGTHCQVRVNTCAHAYVHTHTHAHAHTHVCVCACACMCVHMMTHTHTCMHPCARTHTWHQAYIKVHVYVPICDCMHMHTCYCEHTAQLHV